MLLMCLVKYFLFLESVNLEMRGLRVPDFVRNVYQISQDLTLKYVVVINLWLLLK